MNARRIEEIMVPVDKYPCIPDTLTLRDAMMEMAVQILREKLLTLPRVALVFDTNFNDLLGMLRRRDIMRGFEPKFLGGLEYRRKLFDVAVDPNLSELSSDRVYARVRERANRIVRDYMIPIKTTIDCDDHIMKAVFEMVDKNVSLLPVLENGSVIGVVRSVDVLDEIASIINCDERPPKAGSASNPKQ
ncbi:MAG: CBS domain-containing protein [Candidatus Nealsonbacteria bacterium]|nr:CBS domain-containing protein [Candidatus Nealsonbacteria bacterium]